MLTRARVPSILSPAIALLCLSCGVTDDPDQPFERYRCDGTPAQCLKIKSGWVFEGRISDEIVVDPSVVRLSDGRYRIYGNEVSDGGPRKVYSLISSDGRSFTREAGYRIIGDAGHDALAPTVIVLPNGQFRMYLTDQRTHIGDTGAPAFISAISNDGLTFTWESGNRLTYTGTGNEAGGIRAPNVVRLPNGTWRMYYAGLLGTASRAARLLSAVSPDGLAWTREAGVRLDMTTLCPPSQGGPNPKAFLDHDGVYHVFTAAAACDDLNHTNEVIGIFEGTSTDGFTFNFSKVPVVQGYYIGSTYKGNPTDPFENPEDPMLVLTPAGLRMYFACGNTAVAQDARYYSASNAAIF